MDKYEYQLKLDQLKNLVAAEDYETAAEIANSINWKKSTEFQDPDDGCGCV